MCTYHCAHWYTQATLLHALAVTIASRISASSLIPLPHGIIHGDAKGSMPKIGTKVQSYVGPPHITRQRIQMCEHQSIPVPKDQHLHTRCNIYRYIYVNTYTRASLQHTCNELNPLCGKLAHTRMDGHTCGIECLALTQ